jgi:hypothetical protein
MKRPLPGLGGQSDPPRPLLELHPDMPGEAGEVARLIAGAVASELHDATQRFCSRLRVTGISFVMFGIKHWWDELREVNADATADLFRAMADLAEPGAPQDARLNAEERRRAAVGAIRTSLHEQMEREKGKQA